MLTRRVRRLVLPTVFLSLLLLAFGTPSACAGSDDFEFGQQLAAKGRQTADSSWFDLARKVYQRMLDDRNRSESEKDLAKYGLADLTRNAAIAARANPDVPYEQVVKLFKSAVEDMETFVRKNADHPRVNEAKNLIGTTRLEFVQWAQSRLMSEPEMMEERGTNATQVQADARDMVEGAISYFDTLRRGWDDEKATAMQQIAQYYFVVCKFYAALVHDPCSAQAENALKSVNNDLDEFIGFFDGETVAAYASDIYGQALWELAKCAQREEDQLSWYRQSLQWFDTTVETQHVDGDTLRIIARGYNHIGQLCLSAGRVGGENFLRTGSTYLKKMMVRHPTIGDTDDGIHALLQWARLEDAQDRTNEAIKIASQAASIASEKGKGYLEKKANDLLEKFVTRGGTTNGGSGQSAEVLMGVADSQFSKGRYTDAIGAYQRVIVAMTDSTDDLMKFGVPSWRKIAICYKNLGDLLSASLALEPIHEAWIDGRIPRTTNDENDENLVMAGNLRRQAMGLLDQLYVQTDAKIYLDRFKAVQDSFPSDYRGHPSEQESEIQAAIANRKQAIKERNEGKSGWKSTLSKAESGFRRVAKDPEARLQNEAFVYIIRCALARKDWRGMIKESDAALKYWDGPVAQAKFKQSESDWAKRARKARGQTIYWKSLALVELEQWDAVLDLLKTFAAEHSDLDPLPYLSGALGNQVQAYVGKGDIENAEKYLDKLVAKYPTYNKLHKITFGLARYFESKYSEIETNLKASLAKIQGPPDERAKGLLYRLKVAEKDENRVAERLVDLNGSRRKKQELIDTYDRAMASGGDTKIGKTERDEAEKDLKGRPDFKDEKNPNEQLIRDGIIKTIARLNKELRELTAKRETLEAELIEERKKIDAYKLEMYPHLVKAAEKYYLWYKTMVALKESLTPSHLYKFAYMYFYATELKPEVRENWERAKELNEAYLKLPGITAEDRSKALGKLGKIYSHLASTAQDEKTARELNLKAVELLQGAVANIPENNDLLVGMLAGDFVVLPWTDPIEKRSFRFPMPRVSDVAGFRKAVKELGSPGGTPIPKFESARADRTYKEALGRFKSEMAKEDDQTLKRTVAAFKNAGFDAVFYRIHGDYRRSFRMALAQSYAESGREGDDVKAINLCGTLLRGLMQVDDDSEEFWETQVIRLNAMLNAAERARGASPGAAKADAKTMLEYAGKILRGLKSRYPRLGESERPGTIADLETALKRLNDMIQPKLVLDLRKMPKDMAADAENDEQPEKPKPNGDGDE